MNHLSIIEDGSVLVVNGSVASVGPTRRIENLSQAKNAEVIDANGRLVMPAFIDPYIHLVTPPPSALDFPMALDVASVSAGEILQVTANHLKNTSPSRLEFYAKHLIEGCIRHGTTSLEGKSGFGVGEPGESKALKVVRTVSELWDGVLSGFVAHSIPSQFEGNREAYVRWLCEDMLPRIRDRQLARTVEVSLGPDSLTSDEGRRVLAQTKALGLIPKVSCNTRVRNGCVAVALEADARVVSGLNVASHEDVDALASSRAVVTLLPSLVPRGWMVQYPPARALIDAGVPVALATGHHSLLPTTYSMQPVMSLACHHMKMTAEEVITAATINAAYALGRGSVTGSLEFGKEADLIMLDVSDYREIPYHFGVNLINMTMRKGEIAYREGLVSC